MHLDWVTDIHAACIEARIPFFLKQLGTRLAAELGHRGKGHDIDEFPEHLRVRDYPRSFAAA